MAQYFCLVHHVLCRANDRDADDRYDFTSWEDPAAIESSVNTRPTLRLQLLDSDLLVSESRPELLAHTRNVHVATPLLLRAQPSQISIKFQLHDLDDVQLRQSRRSYHGRHVPVNLHAVRHCYRHGGRIRARIQTLNCKLRQQFNFFSSYSCLLIFLCF